MLDLAVILAGGLGTRLGKLTACQPKALVQVNGRPYLQYQLELLRRHQISKIILLTGYLGEQIEGYFGQGQSLGLDIRYSREESPLGTGGALLQSRHLLPEIFFLLNGDTYIDIDYQAASRAFSALPLAGPKGLMTVFPCGSDHAGNVKLTPAGKMVESYAKGHGGNHDYVDAGALVLGREVIDWLPAGISALEELVYPRLACEGRLAAFKSASKFYDIGTPERLAVFERDIA